MAPCTNWVSFFLEILTLLLPAMFIIFCIARDHLYFCSVMIRYLYPTSTHSFILLSFLWCYFPQLFLNFFLLSSFSVLFIPHILQLIKFSSPHMHLSPLIFLTHWNLVPTIFTGVLNKLSTAFVNSVPRTSIFSPVVMLFFLCTFSCFYHFHFKFLVLVFRRLQLLPFLTPRFSVLVLLLFSLLFISFSHPFKLCSIKILIL